MMLPKSYVKVDKMRVHRTENDRNTVNINMLWSKRCFCVAFLKSTHNIRFFGEIRKTSVFWLKNVSFLEL